MVEDQESWVEGARDESGEDWSVCEGWKCGGSIMGRAGSGMEKTGSGSKEAGIGMEDLEVG